MRRGRATTAREGHDGLVVLLAQRLFPFHGRNFVVGAVGVARGPGLPAVSAAPVDLGNWEWATKPDGVALRRIKLTTGHLDDFSRLSRHRVVSATFARNVSGDSVLGRGQPGGNVINLRI